MCSTFRTWFFPLFLCSSLPVLTLVFVCLRWWHQGATFGCAGRCCPITCCWTVLIRTAGCRISLLLLWTSWWTWVSCLWRKRPGTCCVLGFEHIRTYYDIFTLTLTLTLVCWTLKFIPNIKPHRNTNPNPNYIFRPNPLPFLFLLSIHHKSNFQFLFINLYH